MNQDSVKWKIFIRIITILNAIVWPIFLGWGKFVTNMVIKNDREQAVSKAVQEEGFKNVYKSLSEISDKLTKIESRIYERRR